MRIVRCGNFRHIIYTYRVGSEESCALYMQTKTITRKVMLLGSQGNSDWKGLEGHLWLTLKVGSGMRLHQVI